MEINRVPNVIVEANIPFVQGLLESCCTVRYLSPECINRDAVADADALLVRTRTRCDEALLSGSRCSFIGTATIGTDHIDLGWCRANGITVANAPGCNAPAVAQYVFASLQALANRPLGQYTIGVIGVGHVGSIVERWARQLDMRVLVNDPPRQQAEGGEKWSSLADIAAEADIVTVHTPLDATTRHLIGAELICAMRRAPIVINAARGAVVDTSALVDALEAGLVHHAVIDCWEGEPDISLQLLEKAAIATPHIAGYSYEGKVRATRMVLDALCAHFGLPYIAMEQTVPVGAADSVTVNAISRSYDPLADTRALREAYALAGASAFEALRNTYALRREVAPAVRD